MDEVQKNENGTTVPQADGKPEKEKKPKKELTPQQVQQRRKMIVFPLMFLAFAGCMYLIFAPSGKEDVNVESVGGFNADIPLPAEDGIIADKQKAYEQAVTSRKQQDKIQSLQDFGFTLDDDTEEPQEEINLLPEEDPKPQRGGGASSREMCIRDSHRRVPAPASLCAGAVHHVFSNFRTGDYQHGIVASGERVQPAYGNADFRHERVPGAERPTGI